MMDSRGRLRDLFADDPTTFEDAAERAVEFFRRELVDEQGQPACALVRFFKTHPYADLPDATSVSDLRCLTLIATRGDQPEWNSRLTSRGHRAIPLMSVEMVQQAPMIAQLITQLGLPIANVVRPARALLLDQEQTTHNVFYVSRALGSPHIVAQEEFVARYGIQSVLGFGGLLASGDLFAVILFSKVAIPPDTGHGLIRSLPAEPLIELVRDHAASGRRERGRAEDDVGGNSADADDRRSAHARAS